MGTKLKQHQIRDFILEALTTGGSHHKQWYLEELLKMFVIDFNRFKNKYQWEEGIAP